MIRAWILSLLTLSIAFSAVLFSCEKLPLPDGSPPNEITESDYSIHINTQNRMQKITQWGHDIKQEGGPVTSLTEEASRELFENGNFNLLRIPIYLNAHEPDGSVKEGGIITMVFENSEYEQMELEKIPTDDEWFYIRNKANDKYMKGWNNGDVEMTASNEGDWTQWKLVDAGNGYYHIENKGLQKYMRGDGDKLELVDTSTNGPWAQWELIDADNGGFYLKTPGHGRKILTVEERVSAYQPIIEAINRAKNNGDPDLFASHKMYSWTDFSTIGRNANFGPFYTEDGIDAIGYAAAIDAFMEYIYEQTGKTVKYVAPRCELNTFWTTDKFVEVVNNLTVSPLIVGPEASLVWNSEKFLTDEVAAVTDVKATHNKMKANGWRADAEYDWNAETTGGVGEEFSRFFRELNMSFYVGKVKGIIFWGGNHLRSTDDQGSTGPFRRELVEASSHNLVESDVASYEDGAAAIAFETGEETGIKVFYNAIGTVEFTFDRPLEPGSIPSDASVTGPKSFIVNTTGKTDYRSFTLSFRGD